MNALILCIGLLAQFFYTSRILVQWVQSERSRRIESPTLFWIFSVIGSILLCVYGCMRNDFAIVFGEFLSFYIYLWNLKIKGVYRHLPRGLSFLLPALPLVSLFYVLHDITTISLEASLTFAYFKRILPQKLLHEGHRYNILRRITLQYMNRPYT